MSGQVSLEVKKADWRIILWAVCANFRNAVVGWTFFLPSFIMSMAEMIIHICIFYFLATFIGPAMSPYLARFGGNYAAYIVLGIALNAYLSTSLNSFYTSYCKGYWSCVLELYATSPVGIKAFMAGNILFDYFISTISVLFYIFFGVYVFGLEIGRGADLGAAVLAVLLGMAAVIGIGLIAASTFTLLNAKNWSNPVTWFVNFLVGLVSGVYFPPEVLPPWARAIGYLLPHTYAYDAARMALLSGASITNPLVASALSRLILLSLITIPIGIFLFKKSLRKAEKDGTLSRWT
ncbi:ABC transporter permease [Candidatus Bathyarchaeota archaeon]|nr:MAG: ABC transporter permease [Candidatus Bathyarchaeota archaeon]